MKTIAFINQKGGVGKTTCSVEIASRFAAKGKSVLCVDADPQANMTFVYGLNPDGVKLTLKDVFDGKIEIQKAILKTAEGVDLVPDNIFMADADRAYFGVNSFRMLKKALSSVANQYDYCIIDSPPNLGILNLNVLVATDYVIIPVNANALSLQGLKALSETIREVRESENRKISVQGILLTRYNPRTNMAKEALPALEMKAAKDLDTKVFQTKIRQSIAIEDAQASRHSSLKGRKSLISRDYDQLADEIISYLE